MTIVALGDLSTDRYGEEETDATSENRVGFVLSQVETIF